MFCLQSNLIYLLYFVHFCSGNRISFKSVGTFYKLHHYAHIQVDFPLNPILSRCSQIELKAANYTLTHLSVQRADILEQFHISRSLLTHNCQTLRTLASLKHVSARGKRQLSWIIGTIFGVLGLESLFALNTPDNSGQVRSNTIALEKEQTNWRILNDTLHKIIAHINDQENTLKAVVSEQRKLEQLYAFLNGVQDFLHISSGFSRGLIMAEQGKLSPDLIDTTVMQAITRKLQNQAHSKLNFRLPINNVEEMYQLPCSVIRTANLFKLFIHVPLISTQFQLFQYSDEPLLLKGGKTNVLVELEGEQRLIAVERQGGHQRKPLFIPLTFGKLNANCHQWGTAYICGQVSVFQDDSQHCIAALFFNNIQAIKEQCKFSKSKNKWAMHWVSAAEIEIVTLDSIKISFVCNNGSGESQTIQESLRLKIQNDCVVKIEDSITEAHPDLTVTPTIVNLWNKQDMDSLIGSLGEQSLNRIKRAVDSSNFRLEELQPIEIAHQMQDIKNLISHIILTITSIMIIAFAIFLCAAHSKRCAKLKGYIKLKDNSEELQIDEPELDPTLSMELHEISNMIKFQREERREGGLKTEDDN